MPVFEDPESGRRVYAIPTKHSVYYVEDKAIGVVLDSMTNMELRNPRLLLAQPTRLRRVAAGCGFRPRQVRTFVKMWLTLNKWDKRDR